MLIVSAVRKRVVSKKVVLADVPGSQKPERGYKSWFSWTPQNTRASIRAWDLQAQGLAMSGQPPFFLSRSPCTLIPQHLLHLPDLIDLALPVLLGDVAHPPNERAS